TQVIECIDQTFDQFSLLLGTKRFHIQIVAEPHRTDQAFTSDPLACAPIYITKFVPRKVCLTLFSGAMIEVHHRLLSFQMSSQVLAKLRVAVTVRVIVAIFLPKQLTSDSAAAEFSFVVIKSPFNRSIPIIDYSTSTILLNGICLN